ncbi:MAG: NUDIX hydrolase [Clostridia bacterium]|jgi:ADP-ribose pyrophosphatase|nr:NUDIX hydrolase [Clostridia bacterium]MCI2000740.1 NUDIX hydrolase [Clostridia bacterium]MCI2015187.1 NUDIX hydrolase [Clostridia bacterium]
MSRIIKVKKQTQNKFLNMYEFESERRNKSRFSYFVSSRAENEKDLKINKKVLTADGVAIYGIYHDNEDRVALVKQYRYTIGDYVYEFPAGLVEKGEDVYSAAVREMYEETGLNLKPFKSETYSKPLFTTVGMTDETCSTVFGYLSGKPTNCHQEATEDIQVVLASRDEAKRILKDEKIAVMCAYMLMHFICSKDPFYFIKDLK